MNRLLLPALAALALATPAIAEQKPPGHPPGPGGFGILEFDANADGRVTQAEFDAGQKARFDDIDANKDGVAVPEEFKAHRQAMAETMRKARFNAADTDKNGQLSQAELDAAKASSPKGGKDGSPRMAGGPDGPGRGKGRDGAPRMGGVDADGDKKITFAEFASRGAEGFTRLDTNKDKVVTIAEIQAARPDRR